MKTYVLSTLDSLPYFTIEAARQLFGDGPVASGTIQTALYRWVKAGELVELKKGVYMPRGFFERHRAEADFAPAISAVLIPQSYVSLEYVLQRHGILTEMTYPVSAITLKHTRQIESDVGTFVYRNVKAALYTGFTIKDFHGIPFSMAGTAKALFDFLYFRPESGEGWPAGYSLAENLRLNLDGFTSTGRDEFGGYVVNSGSPKMGRILKNLERTIWRH